MIFPFGFKINGLGASYAYLLSPHCVLYFLLYSLRLKSKPIDTSKIHQVGINWLCLLLGPPAPSTGWNT